MRTVYLNGYFVEEDKANISIFDRGFLFADAIYEVTAVIDAKFIDFKGHMARLHRSLNELGLQSPCSDDEILDIHRALVERNNLTEGLVYMQITRGAADRDFIFPPKDTPPTIVMFTQEKKLVSPPVLQRGMKIATIEDLRWARRDIKTVQLLYPSMAKMAAREKGADDAWFIEDGFITEGTSNNAFIITQDGTLVTRHLSNSILHGITRDSVLKTTNDLNITVEERAFTVEEVKSAAEAFLTSASQPIVPVVEIDGCVIGTGEPGLKTMQLREAYLKVAKETSI
ncbi:MAG: D-amino-acid transaminase [Methylocystaceae bacterium]|nr:D-amino-acid transaminase [Methylocystaceae bacterium]